MQDLQIMQAIKLMHDMQMYTFRGSLSVLYKLQSSIKSKVLLTLTLDKPRVYQHSNYKIVIISHTYHLKSLLVVQHITKCLCFYTKQIVAGHVGNGTHVGKSLGHGKPIRS